LLQECYIYSFDVDLRYINTVDGDFPALLVEEKTVEGPEKI
jgi:hypothetical protein